MFETNGSKPENHLNHDGKYWNTFAPAEQLKPHFHCSSNDEEFYLEIEGTGDVRIFGCWEAFITLKEGRWYEASVTASISGLDNPKSSLLAVAAGHYLDAENLSDGRIELKQYFFYNGDEQYKNKFSVYLRAAKSGKVRWENPVVREAAAPKKRSARIAAVRFPKVEDEKSQTLESLRDRIRLYLEEAGKIHPDLVLLTEFAPIAGVNMDTIEKYEKLAEDFHGDLNRFYYDAAEEVPNGPTCHILSEEARKYGMYVVAGLPEKRGDYVYNTAVIFGRDGSFAGQYDKTHLTFGELMQGISCGEQYPVFDLDFGRVAINICYDEWFPEVARYYAHKGAELLLLPVAGGKPITWRTRALDNNLYFVSSSDNPQSMIIDSSGVILAETHQGGFVYADLDMERRKVNYYGDRTLVYGMPGTAAQMVNTLDDYLLEELARIYKGEKEI